MRALITALMLVALAAPAWARSDREVWEQGIVGLVVSYQRWDEDRPWTKQRPRSRTANAVVVGDQRLLTTADMIDDATLIQLAVGGRTLPIEPRLVHIDRAINLALLEFDASPGTAELRAVALAERTPIEADLRTVRWRRQQLEILATGLVRVEVEESWRSRVEHAFLHLRTDLTNGGWAEPIFRGAELVGINVSQSAQKSRAIPVEILRAFLEQVDAGGEYRGFATLGALWQVNLDRSLNAFLGLEGDPRGFLIRQVPWGSSSCGVLQPRDIVLEIAGEAIDAEGFYAHPRFGRLRFNHLLVERFGVGDRVPLKVLRDGAELDLEMELRGYPGDLDRIPQDRDGAPPYAILGGLLFRELDVAYLKSWGNEWTRNAPISLRTRYGLAQASQSAERRRFVLLTYVLPSPYNLGYQDLRDEIVESVNGRPVSTIEDVIEGLTASDGRHHLFGLSRDSSRGEVVLDAPTLEAATAEILETYRIPAGAVRLSEQPLPEGGGDCPGTGG